LIGFKIKRNGKLENRERETRKAQKRNRKKEMGK